MNASGALLGVLVVGVLAAASRSARAATPGPAPPAGAPPVGTLPPIEDPDPAPSWFPGQTPRTPTAPNVPTEPPKPRAVPRMFSFQALHTYKIVVDVLPVDGVNLEKAGKQLLQAYGLRDPKPTKFPKTVDRPGVGEVTRVTLKVNAIVPTQVVLDRQLAFAGLGSIWLVSAEDVT